MRKVLFVVYILTMQQTISQCIGYCICSEAFNVHGMQNEKKNEEVKECQNLDEKGHPPTIRPIKH